jgi:hypothetical protein
MVATSASAGEQAVFDVNEQGQTYGTLLDGPAGVEPDLIEAEGDDGEIGYVLGDDLDGPDFSSPEEALAWQNSQSKRSTDATIPLYAEDGETVVGSFTLSPTEVVNPGSK